MRCRSRVTGSRITGLRIIVGTVLFCGLLLSGTLPWPAPQWPAAKKTVASETDLPRFSYPISGTASDLLVADDATFAAFTQKVGADLGSIFAEYDIQDKATLRGLLGTRLNVQMLSGDSAGAMATLAQLRDLQEKPDAKAMSGLTSGSILQAEKVAGTGSGPAFQKAFADEFSSRVNALPWAVVQDQIKRLRAGTEIRSTSLAVSSVKAEVDPAVLKSKTVDFPAAEDLLAYRVFIKFYLPLKEQMLAVLTPYVQSHSVQKPDIWAAREVTLTETDKVTPVRIAIWDSGVDTALYPKQLFVDPKPGEHGPHGLAYTIDGKLYAADLQPLTPELQKAYPSVLSIEQGFDDLDNGIDSADAANARKTLSTTPPATLAPFMKQMQFLGQYMHGTHVAGIAVRGNPAARLVVIEFYDSLAEIPFAPTVEWANQFKADFKQVGDYLRVHDVRVVNMSWGDSVAEIEQWLSKTSTEKDPTARKQAAAQIYSIWKDAVAGAIQSAPHTLFVCAAGNSDSNAGFLGDVPASLKLPNLVSVGAVDQAGEETSFTSYGDTVVLHADGFQVESYVPGGTQMKFSGTSMASPNVVNLAAKLIALKPALTPEQTIALMEKSADASPDGRRHLINPKAAVAMLQ